MQRLYNAIIYDPFAPYVFSTTLMLLKLLGVSTRRSVDVTQFLLANRSETVSSSDGFSPSQKKKKKSSMVRVNSWTVFDRW